MERFFFRSDASEAKKCDVAAADSERTSAEISEYGDDDDDDNDDDDDDDDDDNADGDDEDGDEIEGGSEDGEAEVDFKIQSDEEVLKWLNDSQESIAEHESAMAVDPSSLEIYLETMDIFVDGEGNHINHDIRHLSFKLGYVFDVLDPVSRRDDSLATSIFLGKHALRMLRNLSHARISKTRNGRVEWSDGVEELKYSEPPSSARLSEVNMLDLEEVIAWMRSSISVFNSDGGEPRPEHNHHEAAEGLVSSTESDTLQRMFAWLSSEVAEAEKRLESALATEEPNHDQARSLARVDFGETRGVGNFEIARPFLDRLVEVYKHTRHSDTQGMWYSAFAKGLAHMGKSLDAAATRAAFTKALTMQRSVDKQVLKRAFVDQRDRNVFSTEYEQQKIDSKDITFEALRRSWRLRKSSMLNMLNRLKLGRVNDGASISDVDDLAGCPTMMTKYTRREADSIAVVVKTSEEVLQVPGCATVREFKTKIFQKFGILVEHQRLYLDDSKSARELPDTAETSELRTVYLDRAISLAAWCHFYVDTLVPNVDEGKVLEMWAKLCRSTRFPDLEATVEADGGELPDPVDMFCYADDLQRALQGFGREPLTESQAATFIRECRPAISAQRRAGGLMSDSSQARPENKDDSRPRVYFVGYYAALTDDTL